VKKPDVIQKNELYFCNQGSNVIQNQLSKSKHGLKSFVLQACVITRKIACIVLYNINDKDTTNNVSLQMNGGQKMLAVTFCHLKKKEM
jgi:hypothetical protein